MGVYMCLTFVSFVFLFLMNCFCSPCFLLFMPPSLPVLAQLLKLSGFLFVPPYWKLIWSFLPFVTLGLEIFTFFFHFRNMCIDSIRFCNSSFHLYFRIYFSKVIFCAFCVCGLHWNINNLHVFRVPFP